MSVTFDPQYIAEDGLIAALTGGLITTVVADEVAVHPVEEVTVTVYTPAVAVMLCEVSPLLHR